LVSNIIVVIVYFYYTNFYSRHLSLYTLLISSSKISIDYYFYS